MTFRRKVITLLFVAAVLPAALSGLLAIRTSERELTKRIDASHRRSATLVAESVNSFFEDTAKALQLSAELIPFAEFPRGDLHDAVRIPYRQFDFVNIAVLLDEKGAQLAQPVFETHPENDVALRHHEAVTTEDMALFSRYIPFEQTPKQGVAFGPVYFCSRAKTPRIALTVSVPNQHNQHDWVLAVELSLRRIMQKVDKAVPSSSGAVFITDSTLHTVYSQDLVSMAKRASTADLSIVSTGFKHKEAISERYLDSDGRAMAGAFAWIPVLKWGLVVAEPVDQAFAPVKKLHNYLVFWLILGISVAIFGGILFSSAVTKPVGQLAASARRIAAGKFDEKIPVRSKDEIGQLAQTFNTMAERLDESFSTIKESVDTIQDKNREIALWNEELQERVDDRTRELREAHEQIIMSQKLAALGKLGAGIAHEISNPLTGILGYAELMQRQLTSEGDEHKQLSNIVIQSKRIQRIISDLTRFSQNSDNTRESANLNWVVLSALGMVESQIDEHQIKVRKDLNETLPGILCDSADLQQALLHILNCAVNSMLDGGELTLRTRAIEGGALKLVIQDTGEGIAKEHLPEIFDPFFSAPDTCSESGLGLSVASRIIGEHGGKITASSELGKGTLFNVILPGMQ